LVIAKGGDGLKYASGFQRRLKIIDYCKTDFVLNAMGTNDYNSISQGTIRDVYKQFNDNLKVVAPTVQKVVGITILPGSTSTDNWETVVNQTPKSSSVGEGSTRGIWNKEFRDQLYSNWGYDGYIDIAQVAEYDYANYTGVWNVVTGEEKGYTVDGTHMGWSGGDLVASGYGQLMVDTCEFNNIPKTISSAGLYMKSATSSTRMEVVLNGVSFLLSGLGGANANFAIIEDFNNIEVSFIGNAVSAIVNGNPYTMEQGFTSNSINEEVVVGRNYYGAWYLGNIGTFKINNYTYINNGDFGSANLPSIPSGADGTISGATWWKDTVDQNFSTSALYKSQWTLPMEQGQAVVYDLASAGDYIASSDSYWNPYNQDGTYTFTTEILNYIALSIATQPQSQAVAIGDNVALNVVLENGAPSLYQYQWYKNSNLISGETGDTLSIASITENDFADYIAWATDTVTPVLSNTAKLAESASGVDGGFGAIKEQIYTILDSIAVVGGYNFDWGTKRRIDTYIKTSETVTATVHYPEDSPLAEELLEGSTNEYRLMVRTVEIKARVKSSATTLRTENMVDENNEVVDEMLDDLHKAFNSSTLNSCSLGVQSVDFISANKEDITSKGAYFPFLLNAEFQIIYKKER
jgi:hypothetical protein